MLFNNGRAKRKSDVVLVREWKLQESCFVEDKEEEEYENKKNKK